MFARRYTYWYFWRRFTQNPNKRDLQEQRNSCSCLTLILACIIYWQAKEINRVVLECDPEGNGIDLKLLEHISPIAWDNVILYGEYILNRDMVRP